MQPSNQQIQQSKSLRLNHSLTITQNDIQYQIWNNLVKQTSDSLIEKQLRIMADSSQLLDYYSQELAHSKNNDDNATQDETKGLLSGYLGLHKEKEGRISRESMFKMSISNDDFFNPENRNQRNQFQSPNGRTIFRKSPLAQHKSFNFIYSRELKDIEENCRPKTHKAIKALVDDLCKMKQYLTQYESNEKRLIRNIAMLQKQQEKHIVQQVLQIRLNKIHEETQKKLIEQTKQLQKVKMKMKRLSADHDTKSNASRAQSHQQMNISHLLNYLDRKQANINEKFQKVIDIENSTMKMIYQHVEGQISAKNEICQKCCEFIRKAKNTLLKLREFLKEQSDEMQKIYNDYKRLLVEDIKRISNKYAGELNLMSKKANAYETASIC